MSDETVQRAGVFEDGSDTTFGIPNQYGGDAVQIHLRLDVDDPDLSGLDELLSPRMYDALEVAVKFAAPSSDSAADHVLHALSHLRAADFRRASPPLVTGVEGLYWSVAEEDGYLDGRGCFTPVSGRTGKPTNAIGIINALPLNTRVKALLKKRAFGGPANSFRHGRVHSIGEKEQCRLWILALIAWLDGYGWRRFAEALAGAQTDDDLPEGGASR